MNRFGKFHSSSRSPWIAQAPDGRKNHRLSGLLGDSGVEEMTGEFEQRFIKPITNASYPATLAALSLTIYRVTLMGASPPQSLKTVLLVAAATFLLASLSLFFYTLYPTRGKLWTVTAVCYLLGLLALMASVVILLLLPSG